MQDLWLVSVGDRLRVCSHLGFALQGEFLQKPPPELPRELRPELLVAETGATGVSPVACLARFPLPRSAENPKGVLDRRLDVPLAQGLARARTLARE